MVSGDQKKCATGSQWSKTCKTIVALFNDLLRPEVAWNGDVTELYSHIMFILVLHCFGGGVILCQPIGDWLTCPIYVVFSWGGSCSSWQSLFGGGWVVFSCSEVSQSQRQNCCSRTIIAYKAAWPLTVQVVTPTYKSLIGSLVFPTREMASVNTTLLFRGLESG